MIYSLIFMVRLLFFNIKTIKNQTFAYYLTFNLALNIHFLHNLLNK